LTFLLKETPPPSRSGFRLHLKAKFESSLRISFSRTESKRGVNGETHGVPGVKLQRRTVARDDRVGGAVLYWRRLQLKRQSL